MSRIYTNQPLKNIPVLNVTISTTLEKECKRCGNGALLEGTIKGRSKFSVTDNTQNKARFCVFHIQISRSHRRKFDISGVEIEPNFSETKVVRTGFLHSSYQTEAKGQTDKLSDQDLKAVVKCPEFDEIARKHKPSENLSSFWIEESKVDKLEFDVGDLVRLKTDGDGPFIYNIVKTDIQSSTVANFAGDAQAGQSWTDKIMSVKADQEEKQPTEQSEIGDDEWDD